MNKSWYGSLALALTATAISVEAVLAVGVYIPWLRMHPFWLGIVFIGTLAAATTALALLVLKIKPLPTALLFACAVEVLLAFFMASAVFQMAVYWRRPQMAQGTFLVLTVLAFLYKCFAPEIYRGASSLWRKSVS